MTHWKHNLIDAYRIATIPYRNWQHHSRRRTGKVPVYVMFYHRVADNHPNPWTIGCREFERQIDWFEQHFDIVDLEESQRRIQSGFNQRPTLAITFDDGYAENCEFAIPLLVERRIPVTYFVTLQHVLKQVPFPHDVDNGTDLPVNTIESLRALDMAGVEIAAHTRTHADLGKVNDAKILTDEVIQASRELEDLIGRAVRYFAFPFGKQPNLKAEAFQLLKQAGFLGACTTLQGWNEIGCDSFQMARIHGDPSFSRVRNWLTHDPRMTAAEPFPYDVEFKIETKKKAPSLLFPEQSFVTSLATAQEPMSPGS